MTDLTQKGLAGFYPCRRSEENCRYGEFLIHSPHTRALGISDLFMMATWNFSQRRSKHQKVASNFLGKAYLYIVSYYFHLLPKKRKKIRSHSTPPELFFFLFNVSQRVLQNFLSVQSLGFKLSTSPLKTRKFF